MGITLVLAGFVSIQMYLVRLANTGFEGPDNVDYYKMGLEYNKEIQRQEAQRQLGWKLTSNLQDSLAPSAHFPLQIEAVDRTGRHIPGDLKVYLRQPATKRLDLKLPVTLRGEEYSADLKLEPGVWDVTMELQAQSFRWIQTKRVFVRPQGQS
jgi:nitrogen fixation protein FixH